MVDHGELNDVPPTPRPADRPRPTNRFVPYSKDEVEQSIPDRFRRQVERHPHRIAVKSAGIALTYAALDRIANRLAQAVLSRRGEASEPVGLLLGHGAPAVAAIVGILKAGKICVPLDPAYPRARLAATIEDSQAGLIITGGGGHDLAATLAHGETLTLDLDEATDGSPDADPGLPISPAAPAYLMYTSGSTGRPKGVIQEHRAVLHNIMGYTNALHVSADDRVTHLHSCGFSTGMTETFLTLLNAAGLYPFDAREDGLAAMADWLTREAVTLFNWIPTPFRHFVETLSGGERFPSLRLIALGSEPLTRSDVEAYRAHFSPDCLLVNRLGATEVGNYRFFFIGKETRLVDGVVPAGYPVEDRDVLLLDDDGAEVGVDRVGEIAVQSRYISPGYWRQPDLTEAAFSQGPGKDGPRTYRTGDLGRLRPDGCLEYLGRNDSQVKIRGHRVETAEAEAALLDLGTLREAAVVAREDSPGNRRLVAYVVPDGKTTASPVEFRRRLKERLPDYLVPSTYVILDALPVTSSGKVDRRALPAPDRTRPDLEAAFQAPRTPVEEMLAEVWADVLGIDRVGVMDPFLELGGNSLQAIRLVNRVHRAFGIELPLRRLFDAPTVAELATVVVRAMAADSADVVPGGEEREGREAGPLDDTGRTMSGPSPATADLPPGPRATFERLLLDRRSGAGMGGAIPRRTTRGPWPMSFAQQRLWLLDRLGPGGHHYHEPKAFRVKGKLDVVALRGALESIVARHEALRTTFRSEAGLPVQEVAEAGTVELRLIDLGREPAPVREAGLKESLRREVKRPFDLSRDLLLRASLIRLGEEDQVLLLVTHHIASDGWSLGVLLRELSASYEALTNGRPAARSAPTIQYADFAVWQRQRLRGQTLDDLVAYWKRQLGGCPEALDLPADHPRPAIQAFRGASLPFALPEGLSGRLRRLAARAGATPFMVLLAAFQALLHRYTGQDDVIVGSPIAGRGRAEVEGLIGFFVNTIVLRTDLSADPTFAELLGRVREVTLAAYAHQELPFERLVEELNPRRDPARSPIVQVMFVLQNAPRSPLRLSGLALEVVDVDGGTAKFDLTLTMTLGEGDEGLRGSFEYNSDLFERPTIERMAGHYRALLEGAAADPDLRLSELPILTVGERRQLLEGPFTTARPRDGATIPRLFEEQVRRAPGAVAVSGGGRSLTYADLNDRANRLASYLRGCGVGPDVLVGLCIGRSPELVVGMLGVLKAGGAYLPLDPAYPRERLASVLDDARVAVILTEGRHRGLLSGSQARVIAVDADWGTIAGLSPRDPDGGARADHLAYVIYTSGSTGRPKGVMVSHRNVTRLFGATESSFRFGPSDVWTLFHSHAFDFSVWEIWGALLYGGRLVVVPHDVSRSPDEFRALVGAEGVTVLNQTPSAFRLLVSADASTGDGAGLALRLVIFGGEALEFSCLAPWFRRHGDRRPRLVNMYGITETTVHVTSRPITLADLDPATPSLIGRPIPDLRVHVLDRHLRTQPVGIPGEVYVGGAGLARGYHDRPGLTAERFIPDPFSGEPGSRLYRSGDLARLRPDGDLEYLGRADDQVKIRGHRVELGEIEAALCRHPAVGRAAVLARLDETGDRRLAAYVVPLGVPAPPPEALREFLERSLPDYMVPASYVLLGSLPLTPNGKLDRRALPAPDPAAFGRATAPVPPRDGLESRLIAIWEEVLGVGPIGVKDDFFRLGGHSLLAVRLFTRIEESFGRKLAPVALFRASTVETLAPLLRESGPRPRRSALVEVQPSGSAPPFFCLPGGGGYNLSLRRLAELLGPGQPFYSFELGPLDREPAEVPAVEEISASLLRDLRAFRPRGPYHLGGYSFGGLVAFEMARQLLEQGDEIGLLALLDTYGPNHPRRLTWLEREKRFLRGLRGRAPGELVESISARFRHRQRIRAARVTLSRLLGHKDCAPGQVPDPFEGARRAGRLYLSTLRRSPVEVVLFRATIRPRHIRFAYDDPYNGWWPVAGGGVRVHHVPGEHDSILREPGLTTLAMGLRACLPEAQTDGPGRLLVQRGSPCEPAIRQSNVV